MNFHQHHSFKKYLQTVPGTPSFLTGQWGKYKKWGCFWNHPLCVHQAALRPRVIPLLRGGGIAPVACPPATLPSCYSPRSTGQGSLRLTSFHLNTFYNFDSTQQLPDLNVPMPEVRHVSLSWWLCLLSSPTLQSTQWWEGLTMAAPLDSIMPWLILSWVCR